MLIPWQDLSPETLENLIESFVLREGTIMVNMSVHLNRKSPTSNASYSAEKRCWYGRSCTKRSILCRAVSFANNLQPSADEIIMIAKSWSYYVCQTSGHCG